MTIQKSNRIANEFLMGAGALIEKAELTLAENPEITDRNKVAWLLGVSPSTIRRYIRTGVLPIAHRRLLLTIVTGLTLTWHAAWKGHHFCAKSGALVDDAGNQWMPHHLRAYAWHLQELEAMRHQAQGPAQMTWTPAQQAFSRWQADQAGADLPNRESAYSAMRQAVHDELQAQGLL